MLKNYFVIAIRSLLAQKLYSFINLMGLAIGIASCILVALFVESELGYDTQHKEADNIVRLSAHMHYPGAPLQNFATSQVRNGEKFTADFAELTDFTRIREVETTLGTPGNYYNDEGVVFADPNIGDFFHFEVIHGDLSKALDTPDSIVLTRSMAQKYLGTVDDALGKIISIQPDMEVKVTAVIEDIAQNTHLDLTSMVSTSALPLVFGENYQENPSFNYHTYFKLAPGANTADLEARIPEYLDTHIRENLSEIITFKFQPLKDIYLNSNLSGEMKQNGDKNIVTAFTALAVLILTIAVINFMNLATARATKRAKEVGVRKVLGAEKSHLVTQFLAESTIIAFLATFVAVGIVEITLPSFADFVGKTIEFNYLTEPSLFMSLLALSVLVGLMSGSYPAIYLANFRAARVLKGEVTRGKSGAMLRKGLVVLQFSVAIALMILTYITYSQLQYARTLDLGYDKENVIILDRTYTDGVSEVRDTLKHKLLSHPQINHVAGASRYPTDQLLDNYNVTHPVTQEDLAMPILMVDYGFTELYGVKLLAGRSFSESFPGDHFGHPTDANNLHKAGVVINEEATKALGMDVKSAVNQIIKIPFGGDKFIELTIVGVVSNYYFSSFRDEIGPLYHVLDRNNLNTTSIKYTGDTKTVADHVRSVWRELLPNQPIEMRFLDTEFEAMYESENRQMVIFNLFSLLTIFIACLGLFGLASFTTERRVKEIGIRKILGASVTSIVVLLTVEFSKLVAAANVLAWPVSYWIAERWLESFVYRIDLSAVAFVVSGLVAMLIAWVTVGLIAGVAAKARPIHALRYE